MASDAETMLNAMRQQIETQASAMNEFQRQLLETRTQLAVRGDEAERVDRDFTFAAGVDIEVDRSELVSKQHRCFVS